MLGDKVFVVEVECIGMIYNFFLDEEFEEKSWVIVENLF